MSDGFEQYTEGEACLVVIAAFLIVVVVAGWLLIFRWHWWIAVGLVVLPLLLGLMHSAVEAFENRPITEKRRLDMTLRGIEKDTRKISRQIRRL